MKQRWVKFEAWGGEVVKGDKPEGKVIEAPQRLPFHIPMHYWKLQDGQIVEMSDEEKALSDKECSTPAPVVAIPMAPTEPKPAITNVFCNHECPAPVKEVVKEEIFLDTEGIDQDLDALAKRISTLELKPEPKQELLQDVHNHFHGVEKLQRLDWLKIAGMSLAISLLLKLLGI